ncbi:MAG: hypothetical protein K1X57_17150 [Gemmataceae bacterium]|nr:hypothetical protein [Gemmataceae bacterium]
MRGVDDTAADIVRLFDELQLPYALMGGLAVRVYGLPRPTFDVDFAATIDRDRLPELYQRAESMGYMIPEAQKTGWLDTVRAMSVVKLQTFIDQGVVDIDIFLAETNFLRQVMKRRQQFESNRLRAWFVSPEDLVLLKLMANRDKDRADIADIFLIQGSMDRAYMTEWATRLGISEELNRALAANDLT